MSNCLPSLSSKPSGGNWFLVPPPFPYIRVQALIEGVVNFRYLCRPSGNFVPEKVTHRSTTNLANLFQDLCPVPENGDVGRHQSSIAGSPSLDAVVIQTYSNEPGIFLYHAFESSAISCPGSGKTGRWSANTWRRSFQHWLDVAYAYR